MSEDAERVKRIVSLKEKVEKKVDELESELKEQKALLETIDEFLLKKGFTRPEMPRQSSTEAPVSKEPEAFEAEVYVQPEVKVVESATDLLSANGVLLAKLYSEGKSARVVPALGMNFNVNVSPFGHFLVERVLAKMQERDSELVRMGRLQASEIFSYNILRDEDIVREIILKNVDAERLGELTSSVRWTLEKMYEKMKSEGSTYTG